MTKSLLPVPHQLTKERQTRERKKKKSDVIIHTSLDENRNNNPVFLEILTALNVSEAEEFQKENTNKW